MHALVQGFCRQSSLIHSTQTHDTHAHAITHPVLTLAAHVSGSGLALVLGFPLLLLINAPVHYFTDVTTGFWAVLGSLIIYLGLALAGWKYLAKRNGGG